MANEGQHKLREIKMIDILFGSLVKKIAAGAIVLVLLFGALKVRGCLKAKEELRLYHQAEKIRQQDKKTERKIEGEKNEVDNENTPADLDHGFDRLRGYGK